MFIVFTMTHSSNQTQKPSPTPQLPSNESSIPIILHQIRFLNSDLKKLMELQQLLYLIRHRFSPIPHSLRQVIHFRTGICVTLKQCYLHNLVSRQDFGFCYSDPPKTNDGCRNFHQSLEWIINLHSDWFEIQNRSPSNVY